MSAALGSLRRMCFYKKLNKIILFLQKKHFQNPYLFIGTLFILLGITYAQICANYEYCAQCKHIKPDRTHHCSSCNVCVLKMDHHCPWVNNCIGFSNYKSFVLLLFYTTLYCAYIICTCVNYIKVLLHRNFEHVVLVSFVIVVFYFLCGVMLLGCHCFILIQNKTTIEDLQERIYEIENASFDLGCRRNFLEVFGNKWVLWPFPIQSCLGDGYTFHIRILNSDSSNV